MQSFQGMALTYCAGVAPEHGKVLLYGILVLPGREAQKLVCSYMQGIVVTVVPSSFSYSGKHITKILCIWIFYHNIVSLFTSFQINLLQI